MLLCTTTSLQPDSEALNRGLCCAGRLLAQHVQATLKVCQESGHNAENGTCLSELTGRQSKHLHLDQIAV